MEANPLPLNGVYCFVRTVLLVILAGTLAAAQGPVTGWELALVNMDGTRQVLGTLPPSSYAPRVSPDGTSIAYETRDVGAPEGSRLWVAKLPNIADRRSLPNTNGPLNWAPMWSPDGERLVFIVSGDKPDAIYWRRADGTGPVEHLIDTRSGEGWMPGGTQLRFLTLVPGGRDYGISILDVKTKAVTPFIDLPGSAQHSSAVSPDGRWMAYTSNETGRYELWLEPIPRTGARHQLTKDGGSHPLWAPDGRAIYFDRAQQMFRLPFDPANPAAAAQPAALPITGFVQGEYRRQFELMPGGRQFLMVFPLKP